MDSESQRRKYHKDGQAIEHRELYTELIPDISIQYVSAVRLIDSNLHRTDATITEIVEATSYNDDRTAYSLCNRSEFDPVV